MESLGPLIGKGRSADIFAAGPGRVLRRSRKGSIPSAEPAVMRAVRSAGFPVPQVYDVDGADMTMDLVEGPDLLTQLSKRPWHARRIGTMLGKLTTQLAAIPVDTTGIGVKVGEPDAFVHGDLHPGNILLTATGPVVIDWEGAGVGARDADTAITWLLLETAEPDDVPLLVRPLVSLIRKTVLRSFLAQVPLPRPETIAAVCELRLLDTNMRPSELDKIRSFAERHSN